MAKVLEKIKEVIGIDNTGFNKGKSVTFGDASVVTGNKFWTIVSIGTLVILWIVSSVYEWISPIFWPTPLRVWDAFITTATEGYRNFTLWEHLGISLYRIFVGFGFGCLVGIPLGFAIGLSNTMRGMFDPLVEFFRPIPPLAFIPLMIIWFGIDETAKIVLLFLAALWIMVLAAKSGVSSVKLSKIHAAYSLGASKVQILRYVIFPNALPEIFTGMRVSMGVCWGTVVAAELVAAEKGIGFVIYAAQTFLHTHMVVFGIFVIGLVGYGIDGIMRYVEAKLIPWKGKG